MLADDREKQRIFVFGASGHAKVVIDAIEQMGLYEIVFLVDDDLSLRGQRVYGYQSVGGKEDLIASAKRLRVDRGIVAIGSNSAREQVASWLMENGFGFITAVHPAARIGRGVTIGPGTVVMAGGVVNSDSVIGEHVIINTAATVDHDCKLGPFVHIAPGSHLCGTVSVGRSSFVCAGVTVTPNCSIGKNVVVGAGSTVLDDLPDDVTATGSPARARPRDKGSYETERNQDA